MTTGHQCLIDKIIVSIRGFFCFFFQAEDGIRDAQESRGLGMCIRDSFLFIIYKKRDKTKYNISNQWIHALSYISIRFYSITSH